MRTISACALPVLLVACPLLWSAVSSARAPIADEGRLPLAELATGWRGTLVWCVPVALASAMVGWIPGRALHARTCSGRGLLIWVAVVWVAFMPPYAIFYCGWRLCRPGTWIADWAATYGHVGAVRSAVLALSLVSWLWPVAAIAVAALAPRYRSDADDVGLLDPRTPVDKALAAWRRDWPALAVAFLVLVMSLVGETTAFDVAQVVTASSELRLLDAAGASPSTLWSVASVPSAIAFSLVACAVAVWQSLSARRDLHMSTSAAAHAHGVRLGGHAIGIALVVVLVGGALVVPVALLAADGAESGAWSAFRSLHGRAAVGAIGSAAIGGALGALASAVACIAALRDRGGMAVVLPGLVWALGAALPGVLLASAYESLWNSSDALRPVYDSVLVVPMAQVAHAGLACWMLGCWLAARLSREAIDTERLHGRGLRDLMRAHAPSIAAAALGGGALMAAYCVSETVIASRLLPPGAERIAPMLMNAIHYQDQSAVLAALPWMSAMAALMAAVAVIGWWWLSRGWRMRGMRVRMMPLVLALCAAAGAGCDGHSDGRSPARVEGDAARDSMQGDPLDRGGAGFGAMKSNVTVAPDAPLPLDVAQVIGMRGRMPGRLDYPRAADVAADGTVAVIDKSGRVQRFAPDGTFLSGWRMPRTGNGMPTGVTIDRHGRLWIADTHEHRVLVCSPDGAELGSFGGYGRGAGDFIYPTDVLVLDDADPGQCAVVVSEYGGNDRVQWFAVSIASDGTLRATPVRSVGSQGSGTGQFLRPQSMSRMPDGAIAVADACNHRIVMLTQDGQWRGTIGEPGRERGQLSYPYGVLATASGHVLVAEFGNNRIQCLDADGRGLWVRGGGGRETGRLVAPWAIVGDAKAPVVVDAGNCRLVRVRLPGEGER
jgi:hypothetical protein